MKRRKFLIGSGALAAGGAAAMGSGAFSTVEAQRDITIEVADDANAYLALIPLDGEDGRPSTPHGGSYAGLDENGNLMIDMSGNDNGGEGVNPNARTSFDGVFDIRNQGTEDACISWDFGDGFSQMDNAELVFYYESPQGPTDERVEIAAGESMPLRSGERARMGMQIETFGVDATEDDPLMSGTLKFTGEIDGSCFAQFEPREPGAEVLLQDQVSDGTTVTVTRAELPDGGYVSLHDATRYGPTNLGNGQQDNPILDSIVGITELLEPGVYNDLEIELFTEFATFESDSALNNGEELTRSQPLVAIPHRNTPDSGQRFQEDPGNPGTQFTNDDDNIRDGAYDGRTEVPTPPVSNNVGVIRLKGEAPDSQRMEEARKAAEAVRDGTA